MIKKIKSAWASLPHQVQALIIAFGAASGESIVHALADPNAAFTKAEVLHLLKGAIVAGVAAARLFYMKPNRSQQQLPAAPSEHDAPQQ